MIDTDIDTDTLDPAFEDRVRASLDRRAGLAAAVVPPPIVTVQGATDAPSRRRQRFLAAAAVVAAVAGIAAALTSGSDQDIEIQPSTTAPVQDDVAFVADWFPADLAAMPEQAGFSDPDRLDRTREYRVLGRDGRAEVTAMAMSFPIGMDRTFSGAESEDTTVDGRSAKLVRNEGITMLSIALKPGLTLSIGGRSAERADLEALSAAFSPTTGEIDVALLPAGWAPIDDPGRLASVARWTSPSVRSGGFYAGVLGQEAPDRRSLSVGWAPTDDPAATVERSLELWGGERVDVGGRGGVLSTSNRIPANEEQVLVFPIDDRHVGWVFAVEIPRDDLVRFAGSLRPATEAEWKVLATAPPQSTSIDGFELYGSHPEILVRGELAGTDFVVATVDGPAPQGSPYPGVVQPHQIVIRHPDGAQSRVGLGGIGPIIDPSISRDGRIVVITAFAPDDVTDVSLEQDDGALDAEVTPIPGTDSQLVMAILQAVDVSETSWTSALRVVGTNPDGTPYAPPPPGSGMSFALGR